MQDFKKLNVWKKMHELNLQVYQHTKIFPSEEKYHLVSQIRRASTSVATNIAEGCGHSSMKEFRRYLTMAYASSSELEYLLLLSKDLNYFNEHDYFFLHDALERIQKMLYKLKNKLNT